MELVDFKRNEMIKRAVTQSLSIIGELITALTDE
jgi:uncharacterized protein with HEPN domain